MAHRNISQESLFKYINDMIRTLSRPDIIKLEQTDKDTFIRYMAERYYQLRDMSMSLYDMVLEQRADFEFKRLREILDCRDTIISGEKPYKEVNEQFGQRYFDEFVKPVVDKLEHEKKLSKKDNSDHGAGDVDDVGNEDIGEI